MLVPRLVTTLKGYSRQNFVADLGAGVIVGVVALPLAIAFAIASGVAPERGLWTVVVAGLIISALGGSRVQIGGPTGAFVVVVYAVVQRYGYDGLAVATLMAGVILVALGIARLGGAIKFIPHSVTTGFTAGIAVIIFTQQIKDLAELQIADLPPDFVGKWTAYLTNAFHVSPNALGVSALTLAIILLWPRLGTRVPGPFVALVAATVLVRWLELDVETIGSRFGEIRAALPSPHVPQVSWSRLIELVQPAITIALLAGIESLLSAVVSDGMIGSRHRSNMELVATGVANIASPIFGGIPATGAIARTATNVKNGGRTPVAGIVHALVVLLVTLFFGKWAALIPMAALAAILVVVAYHMSEWRTFRAELKAPRSDVIVLLVTFGLTVLVDLTVAVQAGLVLSAFLFMKRMSEVTNVSAVTREWADEPEEDDPDALARRVVPPGVQVYEVNGPFFFGAAETFKDAMAETQQKRPKVLIIGMRNVPATDSTGLARLREVIRRSRKEGSWVILAGVQNQPREAVERAGLADELGRENLCADADSALARARELLGDNPERGIEKSPTCSGLAAGSPLQERPTDRPENRRIS